MKAYIVKQEGTGTHFITVDIIDILNIIELPSDSPVTIHTKELTKEELVLELEYIRALNMSITIPNQ